MRDFKVYQASGYLTKLVTDASDVRKEYEEISGSLVQFDTPISAPLASLMVDINLVQSGTGEPSPTNVRPITGWTGCEVWVKDEYDTSLPATASVTFPDTVYGGKYDFVSGEGDSNLVKLPLLSSYAWQLDIAYGRRFSFPYGSNPSFKKATNKNGTFIGNILAPVNIGVNSHDFGTFYISNSWLVVHDNNSHFNSLEDFKSWLESEDVYIVYEVAEPTEIQLTPQEINTLQGVNNIWADTGDVSVKYRTH